MYFQKYLKEIIFTTSQKVDVIFFYNVNSGHLKNNIDFYFGKLPKVLKKKSITVLNNETS